MVTHERKPSQITLLFKHFNLHWIHNITFMESLTLTNPSISIPYYPFFPFFLLILQKKNHHRHRINGKNMTRQSLVWGLELCFDHSAIISIFKRRLLGRVHIAIPFIYNISHPASILNDPSTGPCTLSACISLGIDIVLLEYSNIHNGTG